MDIRLLSKICWDWGVRCFGIDHMCDQEVRSLRAAEEMIELNQALGVDPAKLHLLIETVYSRPQGKVHQEFGGVLVTLLVLAERIQLDIEVCLEDEVHRILSKSPEHFAKRNQEKLDMGLT
jgi:NTP pyrophosphatase (non-canonical NTP hydrolase)